jgi:molybdopterin converting factor small subunit
MDVHVSLYGPLRGVTGEKTVELAVETDEGEPTLDDVVRAFVERYPRSRDQLYTEDGTVRPSVRLLCDGEPRDRDTPVTGDVSLFPAMRGG